jgi:hypothetical protein
LRIFATDETIQESAQLSPWGSVPKAEQLSGILSNIAVKLRVAPIFGDDLGGDFRVWATI